MGPCAATSYIRNDVWSCNLYVLAVSAYAWDGDGQLEYVGSRLQEERDGDGGLVGDNSAWEAKKKRHVITGIDCDIQFLAGVFEKMTLECSEIFFQLRSQLNTKGRFFKRSLFQTRSNQRLDRRWSIEG